MDGEKQLILSKKSYTKIRRFEQTEDNKNNLLKNTASDSKWILYNVVRRIYKTLEKIQKQSKFYCYSRKKWSKNYVQRQHVN